MHAGTCTRVQQDYKYRIRAEHSFLAQFLASEAVKKGSAHPPTPFVYTKFAWVFQHCYPKPSCSSLAQTVQQYYVHILFKLSMNESVVKQITIFAPPANMDLIIMMQIYDTVQIYRKLLFLLLRQIRVKCSFGILQKQEQTPLQIRVFAIFLPAFEVLEKLPSFPRK